MSDIAYQFNMLPCNLCNMSVFDLLIISIIPIRQNQTNIWFPISGYPNYPKIIAAYLQYIALTMLINSKWLAAMLADSLESNEMIAFH